MTEKRRHSRLIQKMPIRYSKGNGDKAQDAFSCDISAGGVRISTNSKLDIGAEIGIEVHINSSGTPYYAQGEVVWLKENNGENDKAFGLGVKFKRIVTKQDLKGF